MSKKMLIDATHAEETRVAILDSDGILEEFDYESIVRKQLKGNIFLAKVTRVEPSLQAAFVNFGGNRHGFLPYSEIHPDYFVIPQADREALLAEEEAELARLEEEKNKEDEEEDVHEDTAFNDEDTDDDDTEDDEEDVVEVGGADKPGPEEDEDAEKVPEADEETSDEESSDEEQDEDSDSDGKGNKRYRGRRRGRGNRGRRSAAHSKRVEMIGGDGVDSDRPVRSNLRRKYKIQEVVKRGQIMLVQVSKEERGNKGAAVSSYLSLPGRYCVLMPNSPRGGGVSRKIANYKDRRRMKEVMDELEIPKGMSVILRTAGVQRTKAEIKRDFDYLIRLWNNVRELTLESIAPALVYEEGSLIKRCIRDLYTRDIDEIEVSGDEGYKHAKEFMKMLIPSHVKRVKEYKDDKIPLFHKYGAEKQIAEIGEVSVTLKSGGYLVINPTEALVSIDVNSGRATKERHIEETALKTNLEAADEVARQMRLRDLGGLVVIDFIDMEDRRNNRKVENRLRDALSNDRARIQIGRISSFGLLELSRQRLNPSLTEAMFRQCPHCEGAGHVNTVDAAAIKALRALEETGIKGGASKVALSVCDEVALYIMNNKRAMMNDIENRYGFQVLINSRDELAPAKYEIEILQKSDEDEAETEAQEEDQKSYGKSSSAKSEDDKSVTDKQGRRRGRRGGRRRGGGRNKPQDGNEEQSAQDKNGNVKENRSEDTDGNTKDEKPKKSARAPRKKKDDADDQATADTAQEEKAAAKPKKEEKSDAPAAKDDKKKPAKKDAKKPAASNDDKEKAAPKEYETVNEAPEKKKKGWWNKIV